MKGDQFLSRMTLQRKGHLKITERDIGRFEIGNGLSKAVSGCLLSLK
jgi:hypothetical protein